MSTLRVLFASIICLAVTSFSFAQDKTPYTVVVMDPLSSKLSCPCVDGYAQRDYEKLAKHLEKQLGRPIDMHFSESLHNALEKKTGGKADLVIGKESVVRNQAKEAKLEMTPVASLTGKDGKTTMTGLFVLGTEDKALVLSDLKGYRVLFGPANADEKHKMAIESLQVFEVGVPKSLETCNSCSVGATKVLELQKKGEKAVTVISSYALPILEGCGTVKKGDLRVVGETDPVPFIVAYVNGKLPSGEREAIQKALMTVGSAPDLCTVMETKAGFVALETSKKK